MVKFNSTNSTKVRNKMFRAVARNVSRPCTGGYNRQTYANVASLWAQGPFKVSQNSEWFPRARHVMLLLLLLPLLPQQSPLSSKQLRPPLTEATVSACHAAVRRSWAQKNLIVIFCDQPDSAALTCYYLQMHDYYCCTERALSCIET
jgi:hypothetical protein